MGIEAFDLTKLGGTAQKMLSYSTDRLRINFQVTLIEEVQGVPHGTRIGIFYRDDPEWTEVLHDKAEDFLNRISGTKSGGMFEKIHGRFMAEGGLGAQKGH